MPFFPDEINYNDTISSLESTFINLGQGLCNLPGNYSFLTKFSASNAWTKCQISSTSLQYKILITLSDITFIFHHGLVWHHFWLWLFLQTHHGVSSYGDFILKDFIYEGRTHTAKLQITVHWIKKGDPTMEGHSKAQVECKPSYHSSTLREQPIMRTVFQEVYWTRGFFHCNQNQNLSSDICYRFKVWGQKTWQHT